MQIFRNSEDLKALLTRGSAVTVGTFDGVHLGHRKLLSALVSEARRLSLASVAVTFEPHPIYILRPEIKVERIVLPEEKIERLSKFGLDYLVILDFNKELANLEATLFFKQILVENLNCRFIALGYNHTFGRGKEGNLDFLQKIAPSYGCEVVAVEPGIFEGEAVSSSRIRKAIKDGEVARANQMLVEEFCLPGLIVKGKRLGMKLGFPTINVKVDQGKLLPRVGVYAAQIKLATAKFPGMMFVNPEPDLWDAEANLFGYEGEAYNQRTVLIPSQYTREAIKFSDQASLAERLAKDESEIKRILGIN